MHGLKKVIKPLALAYLKRRTEPKSAIAREIERGRIAVFILE
jgi:hypothetical protein